MTFSKPRKTRPTQGIRSSLNDLKAFASGQTFTHHTNRSTTTISSPGKRISKLF